MLNLQQQVGSIEVGKSADLVVLDQDMLESWFQGKEVYAAAATPPR